MPSLRKSGGKPVVRTSADLLLNKSKNNSEERLEEPAIELEELDSIIFYQLTKFEDNNSEYGDEVEFRYEDTEQED